MAIPFYDFAFLSESAMDIGKMLLHLLGWGIPIGLSARLDYREPRNRQVVQEKSGPGMTCPLYNKAALIISVLI